MNVQSPSPLYRRLKLLPGDDQFADGIENVDRESRPIWTLQAHSLLGNVTNSVPMHLFELFINRIYICLFLFLPVNVKRAKCNKKIRQISV